MLILTLLYALLRGSLEQNPILRKTTVSNNYMSTVTLCYYPAVNASNYTTWTVVLNKINTSNNYYASYSNINSISSGDSTNGFQIIVQASPSSTSILLLIPPNQINTQGSPLVWYSLRISIFSLPTDVPYNLQSITTNIFSTIGQNLYTTTTKTFPQVVSLYPNFTQYCYYDSSLKIKDKIYVLPSVSQLFVPNPEFVNLTSRSSWQYDWNTSPVNISFDLNIQAYSSQALYVSINILSVCPNSYKYTAYNLSMGISSTNWFSLQPTNSTQNKYRKVTLEYPFSNDTNVILGMQITGFSIHSINFSTVVGNAGTSLMFVSFNVSQGYDSNNSYTGYLGNISYYVVNPTTCYGYYWIFGNLGGCPNNLIQYNATHCVCPNGSNYTTGRCLICQVQYHPSCNSCNLTSCLSCEKNLFLYVTGNTTFCLNCSQLYGEQCSKCSGKTCLQCQHNYTVDINNQCSCQPYYLFVDTLSGNCTSCSLRFQFCTTCTPAGCSSCQGRFSAINGSCTCIPPNVLARNTCLSCSDLYAMACILCDNTSCTQCDTNFQLIDNSCRCNAQGIILSNQKCYKCSDFYGVGCLNCNNTVCLSCGFNFINNQSSCVCPPVSFAVSNASCYLCKEVYPHCVECSNVSCSKCQTNFLIQNNTCVCNGDRYLTLGRNCQLCANIHQNCASCNNRSFCMSCSSNFTLVYGRCLCSFPRLINPNDSHSCLLCEEVKGSLEACQFSVSGQFYQSGKVLYFWLSYNRPLDQISFFLPIQYNIKVTIAGVNTLFSFEPQAGIFTVNLSKLVGSSTAEVTILEKEYILFDRVQLNNDPLPFTVNEVHNYTFFDNILEAAFQNKNYTIFFIAILSLGAYSKMFKSLTIISVVCLSQQNLPNSIGLISNALNLNSPFDPLNLNIELPFNRIPCQELRMVAYGLNKPILTLSLQLYAAGLLSICLIAYIRGYLKTKRHANKHRAFRNILKHSKEYLLQNVLNLQMLLTYPALLQIRLICSLGFNSIVKNAINLGFAVFLLAMQALLISLYIIFYRFDRYNYSMLFNQLRPSRLTFAYWVYTAFQPFAIAIFALFVPLNISLYLIIAANSLQLLLLLLCLPFCYSKAGYFIDLGKAVCVLYISIALIFNHTDSVIVKIGAYLILAVCVLQFLQIVFKSGELILRNKGIISDFKFGLGEVRVGELQIKKINQYNRAKKESSKKKRIIKKFQ